MQESTLSYIFRLYMIIMISKARIFKLDQKSRISIVTKPTIYSGIFK